jgi:lipoyl(octanoyl) transferase
MDLIQNLSAESISVQDWGLIDYELALQKQTDLVDLVHQELARETLVFCTHPPVVTLGRGTKPGDVFGWQGPAVEINRGGRATYHGPSQMVVYPILDLNQRGRDLHKYMRNLETAVVRALSDFGISASGQNEDSTEIPPHFKD